MKTADEIYEEMKNEFLNKTGEVIRQDSEMGVRMAAFAAQAESLYIYNDWVMRQCYPQTASGEYLDMQGSIRGVYRKPGVKSKGELSFSVKVARQTALEIPSGVACVTADGTAFVTTEAGSIAVGETMCTVAAEAEMAGEDGNVTAETICIMTAAPVGVENCVNLQRFQGGKAAESDEALRARILESYRSLPNGANAAWYKKTVSAIEGVGAVSVIPKSRGAGTVDIIVAGEGGMPSDNLLSAVEEKLEETREICVDIQVKAPNPLLINMSINVKTKSGFDPVSVCTSVKTAVENMFGGKMLGVSLLRAQISDTVYHVPGVENYVVVSPDYDYTGSPGVILMPGTITVSEWR